MSNPRKGIDLVLVSHGVRGPSAPASARLHAELVEQLQASGQFNSITWGYLTCAPYLENVVTDLESKMVVVLPMLMSDGWFSKHVIPEKLGLSDELSVRDNSQHVIRCSPFGLNMKLADVMLDHALAHCREQKLTAGDTSLIVVGHGSSKDDASHLATLSQVTAMRRGKQFKDVHEAYLEQAPDFAEVLREVSGEVLVIGFFANQGTHATEDVDRLIRQSGLSAHYLGPVGALEAVGNVVMDCVEQAISSA